MRNTILEALSDNIVIDKDKCIYCGECVDTCILDNLRMKLAPCRQACPLGLNCQGYVQMILRGENDLALEMIERVLPFPSILGRICSAQCEAGCHRGKTDGQPVAIRALKRYVSATSEAIDLPLPPMAETNEKHCAIIGSGPAGMIAAWDLLVKGYRVTVIDSEDEPGGMLRWAIPSFRLPDIVLQREFDRLKTMGMIFQGNTRLGKDIFPDRLAKEYDAVIIATGCQKSKELNIPGEDLPGVLHALPLLHGVREGQAPEVGRQVVVIGGGDVAVDSAQTALRLGADKVTMVSLEDTDILPAGKEALDIAAAEGIEIYPSWGPTRIQAHDGKLTGIELQRCLSVFDASGRFAPSFDDCILKDLEADTVIVAIGQERDLDPFNGQIPRYNELTLQTEQENVFIAGDVKKGPSTVVEAMASGRVAAESVHRFLCKEHLSYGRRYEGPIEKNYDIDTSVGTDAARTVPARHTSGREGDFKEIEQVLTDEQARTEAGRCYSCGAPFGKFRTCWFCLPCEVECPTDALWVEIPYLLR
ncbi:FAD-dependent oxidoreductase [Desulfospira joergensenii]|uniref:FAD-dependent oxidoreductase n=1 Tax=Desulfospira joergensenii TaxID=53329 RepID=UPI00137776E0|nr:FAD-dependent oxidoreductase [Desulfospira joergensenii]